MENQYQAPPQKAEYRSRSSSGVSSRIVDSLGKTKIWPRVISILGFILGGLITFNIFGSLAYGVWDAQVVLHLIFCGIIFYFSFVAGQYANRLSRFSRSQSESDLASALKSQHAIWRLMGILWVFGALFIVMAIFLDIANAFA